jgi:Apea-like HEPN
MSYTTTQDVIKNWIERAENEKDTFNKFISYWIAFNCWYSMRYSLDPNFNFSDRNCIKKIKEEIQDDSLTISFDSNLKKELDTLKLRNMRKTLRTGIDAVIPVNSDSDVIEWLYIARNNLFHGNKLDENNRDKLIINQANIIIKKVIDGFKISKDDT